MTSFTKKRQKINQDANDPGIVQIGDREIGALQALSPSGTMEVGELIRLVGGNFESGDLLPNLWKTAFVGTGNATSITGELNLTTGVTANSSASVQSQKRAIFITATFNKAHLAVQCADFFANDVVCSWGMFDPVEPTVPGITSGDGVCFENRSGVMSIIRRKAGVNVEVVPEAQFNGNDVPGQPDVKFIKDNNVHIYEIVYNAGAMFFFQDRRLIHKMTSSDAVAYETTHLPLGISIENINGNTTNHILRTRGFSCSRIGSASAQPDSILVNSAGSSTIKNSPGTLKDILILDTGTGGANIELFDDTIAPFGNSLGTVNLTQGLIDLKPGLDFNFGLSYTASGAQFQVILVFE